MSFKGISADNDVRYTNAERKLLQSTKFPTEFGIKVDMEKVNLKVMRPWIAHKVSQLLGFEDEVVIELILSTLQDSRWPDPKRCQINLTGFLERKTAGFMLELWKLLCSAQDSPEGIPARFVEEKKKELQIKQEEAASVSVSNREPRPEQSYDDFERPQRVRDNRPPGREYRRDNYPTYKRQGSNRFREHEQLRRSPQSVRRIRSPLGFDQRSRRDRRSPSGTPPRTAARHPRNTSRGRDADERLGRKDAPRGRSTTPAIKRFSTVSPHSERSTTPRRETPHHGSRRKYRKLDAHRRRSRSRSRSSTPPIKEEDRRRGVTCSRTPPRRRRASQSRRSRSRSRRRHGSRSRQRHHHRSARSRSRSHSHSPSRSSSRTRDYHRRHKSTRRHRRRSTRGSSQHEHDESHRRRRRSRSRSRLPEKQPSRSLSPALQTASKGSRTPSATVPGADDSQADSTKFDSKEPKEPDVETTKAPARRELELKEELLRKKLRKARHSPVAVSN